MIGEVEGHKHRKDKGHRGQGTEKSMGIEAEEQRSHRTEKPRFREAEDIRG